MRETHKFIPKFVDDYSILVLAADQENLNNPVSLIEQTHETGSFSDFKKNQSDSTNIIKRLSIKRPSPTIELLLKLRGINASIGDSFNLHMKHMLGYDAYIFLCDPSNEKSISELIKYIPLIYYQINPRVHILLVGTTNNNTVAEKNISFLKKEGYCIDYMSVGLNTPESCLSIFKTLGFYIHDAIPKILEITKEFKSGGKWSVREFTLKQNPKKIDFMSLDDRGAEWIASAIESGNFMKGLELNLPYNTISDFGAKIILKAIKKSDKYIKINLNQNKISGNLIKEIEDAVGISRFANRVITFYFLLLSDVENIIPKDVKNFIFLILMKLYDINQSNTPLAIRISACRKIGFFREEFSAASFELTEKDKPLSFTNNKLTGLYIDFSLKTAKKIFNKIPTSCASFISLTDDDKNNIGTIHIQKSSEPEAFGVSVTEEEIIIHFPSDMDREVCCALFQIPKNEIRAEANNIYFKNKDFFSAYSFRVAVISPYFEFFLAVGNSIPQDIKSVIFLTVVQLQNIDLSNNQLTIRISACKQLGFFKNTDFLSNMDQPEIKPQDQFKPKEKICLQM